MADRHDKEYYEGRAAQSRLLAEMATDPGIRAIHLEMAASYEARAAQATSRVDHSEDGTTVYV